MKHLRRSPRQLGNWQQLCHECEDAVKSNSNSSEKQGEQAVGFPLSPNPSRNVAAVTGVDINDPTVQLANIVVELEDGCVERIKMSDNESAEDVAKKVCRKNNLPDQFVALLAQHITDRYPQRPVDKPKEDKPVHSNETMKDSKSEGKGNKSESSTSCESKEK